MVKLNKKYVHFFSLLLLIAICSLTCNKRISHLDDPFYVDPATQNFSENPALLERILKSPHGYFRFINIQFSNQICKRFEKAFIGAPVLNLHGDAHLEQYAVTDLGRGLTDFDDSSTGPGFIDMLRFGVSADLVCRERGWEGKTGELFETFLNAYKSALKDPGIEAPVPEVVSQIAESFTIDRVSYFKWINELMEPMDAGEEDSLKEAIKSYTQIQLIEDKKLNRDYFNIVKTGRLRMGIGSALDKKYLMRVKGKTNDPGDDVVLEIKEVRDLSAIDCISSGRDLDPFRIIRGQARIAYSPFKHLGYFVFGEHSFWVHSWVDNYKEVDIYETFENFEQLQEVAYDIGVQLGKGHIKYIAYPFDLQLRTEQAKLVDRYEDDLHEVRLEFSKRVSAAWDKFREYYEK